VFDPPSQLRGLETEQGCIGQHSGERILAGIMMLLGVGTLLPFNVFATERTFYEVRTPAVSVAI
jgi:hypothetical protein